MPQMTSYISQKQDMVYLSQNILPAFFHWLTNFTHKKHFVKINLRYTKRLDEAVKLVKHEQKDVITDVIKDLVSTNHFAKIFLWSCRTTLPTIFRKNQVCQKGNKSVKLVEHCKLFINNFIHKKKGCH